MSSITIEVVNSSIAVQAGLSQWYDVPVSSVVVYARASIMTAQATGNPITVDLQKNGTSIISSPLTIASGSTASQPEIVVVSAAEMDRISAIVLGIGDGTAMGLKVTFGISEIPSGTSGTVTPPPNNPPPPTETVTLVDRTTGAHFGNMSVLGGVASAFDGNANKTCQASAAISASPGYVGTTWSTGKKFSKAIVSGGNNGGFLNGGGSSVAITVYGGTSQPATLAQAQAGTSLGTASVTDTANQSAGITINSTDSTTKWTSIWALISAGGSSTYCAQLVLYELLP